jgi:putative transposase
MVDYRRNRVPGATYFFTATLIDRRSSVLVEHIDLLRQAHRETVHQRPFSTVAIAVLPDHLHAIWKLPDADCDYSSRWRAIKSPPRGRYTL